MTAPKNRSVSTHTNDTTDHLIMHYSRGGAGIQQQPHAVRVTIGSGTHQRRPSELPV
jgi:hypothetical protein